MNNSSNGSSSNDIASIHWINFGFLAKICGSQSYPPPPPLPRAYFPLRSLFTFEDFKTFSYVVNSLLKIFTTYQVILSENK